MFTNGSQLFTNDSQLFTNDSQLLKKVPNYLHWFPIAFNGCQLFPIVPSCFQCLAVLNCLKWIPIVYERFPIVYEWFPIVYERFPIVYEWFPIVYNGSTLLTMVYNCLQWFTIVYNGSTLFTMVPHCLQWFPVVYNGFQVFKNGLKISKRA